MKHFLCLVFAMLATCSASCRLPEIPAKADEPNFQYQKCYQWEKLSSRLNENELKTLDGEGVIFFAGDEDNQAQFVIGPTLIDDCQLRLKIGRFLWVEIRGTDEYPDPQFGQSHSTLIVRTVDRIWDSKAFSSDGIRQGKYSLLSGKFSDDDVSPLVSRLLRQKNLNLGLFNVILEKPLPEYRTDLDHLLNLSIAKGNQNEEFYLHILKVAVSQSPESLRALRRKTTDSKYPVQTRAAIRQVVEKLDRGDVLTPDDLEALNIPIPDDEEQRKL